MASPREVFNTIGDGLKEVFSRKKPETVAIPKPTAPTPDVSGELEKGTVAIKGKTKKQQALDEVMKGS